MRRLMLLALAMLAGSCGGPSSPIAPPVPSPAQLSLANGSYRLTIMMSTTGGCPTSPICTSVSLCSSLSGSGIVAEAVPTGVALQRDGDTIAIRPDDPAATFRMTLQQSGAALSGTAFGGYGSLQATLTVSDGLGGPAAVTGVLLPSFGVSGNLTGDVEVNGTGCSNNGHTWTLTPQ